MGQNRPGTTGLDGMNYYDIIKCKTTTFIKSKVKHRVGLCYVTAIKVILNMTGHHCSLHFFLSSLAHAKLFCQTKAQINLE